jgi:release factor glutamine methyltransferase
MSTVREALLQAAQQGLDRIDAQLLLLQALGRDTNDRAWLVAHDGDALTPEQSSRFVQHCQLRTQGEPVAYILGQREFYGLMLQVDARVLDPRPDTETLVDWALSLLPPMAPHHVLDLGTGSGAMALALSSQRPVAQVSAVDKSTEALAVARANGQRLGLRVTWKQGSWFEPLAGERFDLIVSNPPYIREDDPHMARLTHEPRMALTSGVTGLDDIARIASQAPAHMNTGAWLLLEHGHDQAADVAALLARHGFVSITHRHDLAGIARCTGGQRP